MSVPVPVPEHVLGPLHACDLCPHLWAACPCLWLWLYAFLSSVAVCATLFLSMPKRVSGTGTAMPKGRGSGKGAPNPPPPWGGAFEFFQSPVQSFLFPERNFFGFGGWVVGPSEPPPPLPRG